MNNIKVRTIDLNTLRSNIQAYDFDKKQLCERTLEVGNIKYYLGVPLDRALNKKLEYYFTIATIPSISEIDDKVIEKAIGMIELQVSPYNDKIMWLKFVSVDEGYKNLGVATKMLHNMCDFLQKNPYVLERSKPSDEGEKYITQKIDTLLVEYKITQHVDEHLRESYKKKKMKV